MRSYVFGFISLISLACESPSEDPPKLEIELLGCIDEPHPMDTCAEFCEWDGAVCAEQACDGLTARSFPGENICVGDVEKYRRDSPLGCDDPLEFDPGPNDIDFDPMARISYRCCCDYR